MQDDKPKRPYNPKDEGSNWESISSTTDGEPPPRTTPDISTGDQPLRRRIVKGFRDSIRRKEK